MTIYCLSLLLSHVLEMLYNIDMHIVLSPRLRSINGNQRRPKLPAQTARSGPQAMLLHKVFSTPQTSGEAVYLSFESEVYDALWLPPHPRARD
jgi:hypothetical protein